MRKSPENSAKYSLKAGASRVGSTQEHMHLRLTRRDCRSDGLHSGAAEDGDFEVRTRVLARLVVLESTVRIIASWKSRSLAAVHFTE